MEKKSQTYVGTSLSKAIKSIIKETMKGDLTKNAQVEKERQNKFLGEEDDDLLDAGSSDEKKPSKTVEDEKQKLKKGEITFEDVIEKLNTIRSGKSFKDAEIKNKMEEYVESLTKAERTALFAFLKGISQLTTGEFDPADAQDPSDLPSGIEMEKTNQQSRSLKPNVIKTPKPNKEEKKKPSAEDTSGPVPIKPKK